MAPADDGADLGLNADRGDNLTPPVPAETTTEHDAAAAELGLKAEDEAENADGDDEADEEAEKKAKKPKDEPRIPKSRLDKVLKELQDAKEQLAKTQQTQQQEENNADLKAAQGRLSDLEKQLTKQIADGETEKAAATLASIRELSEAISDFKAETKAAQATAQAVEQVRESMVIDRIEEAYPELNPSHEDYDESKIAKVLKIRNGLMATGDSRSAAMQEAVKLVMGDPKTAKERTAVDVTPRVNKDDVAGKRKADAVARNTDAANKQPPTTAKVGTDSDKLGGGSLKAEDVMKMTQDEFAQLDEKTLAKMRGDEV
jgi:microcompartment protein CcmL/EutN